MNIALIQMNSVVGDLAGNAARMVAQACAARDAGAVIAIFPEMALLGYPPDDLVLKPSLLADADAALGRLARDLPPDLLAVVGAPLGTEPPAANAAVVLHRGHRVAAARKMLLPNYGVFDEKRVFTPGPHPTVFEFEGLRIGLHVCEDSWWTDGPAFHGLAQAGLSLLVNLSASPYHRGKPGQREEILRRAAQKVGAPVLYTNLIGGQDELVFDGGSMALDRDGRVCARARPFAEDLLLVELDADGTLRPGRIEPPLDGPAEVYAALRLGLRDYMDKNRFTKALVALSGGIDSALVAAIAADALGPDRVVGVTLPTRFSSNETHADALRLATNLGLPCLDLPIERLFGTFLEELAPAWSPAAPPRDGAARWEGRLADTPAPGTLMSENLQARIRGVAVMALSNAYGWLVLSTGNKSEIATGYCTLYGDMCGGFALIKDVPKTLVFALARWRNARDGAPVIPPSTIERPPSAELRPGQKDTDALPPYDVLDPLLERYIEQEQGPRDLVAAGFDPAVVRRVVRLVDRSEYKRRQAAPGVKITARAFGRDRRMPVTCGYDPAADLDHAPLPKGDAS